MVCHKSGSLKGCFLAPGGRSPFSRTGLGLFSAAMPEGDCIVWSGRGGVSLRCPV